MARRRADNDADSRNDDHDPADNIDDEEPEEDGGP
jgi:hypothetical protein